MYAIRLGDDGAELRPLEPWRADELLRHMDRGREFIGRHIAHPDAVTDLASRRIIDWAVKERGIHRVEWRVAAANAASIAVARRLGMTREGVLRESYLYRGERHDIEIWSVLAPEWRTQRR